MVWSFSSTLKSFSLLDCFTWTPLNMSIGQTQSLSITWIREKRVMAPIEFLFPCFFRIRVCSWNGSLLPSNWIEKKEKKKTRSTEVKANTRYFFLIHDIFISSTKSRARTSAKTWFNVVYNGNRTEWSTIRSVIIRVIYKIGRPRRGSPLCLSRVWFPTELDDKKSCYQLIVTISISEKTNTPRTNISSKNNVFSYLFLHFGNCLVFLWIDGCCYGYCDQFCDWWI